MSTERITVKKGGDWFVITDEETGVTTQGESKIEALMMLADALALYEDSNEDLMEMARDVFTTDDKGRNVMKGFGMMKDVEGFREAVEEARTKDDSISRPAGPTDDYYVEVADEVENDLAEAGREIGLSDDKKEALEEIKGMISENSHTGKPMLRPPLEKEEIEKIEDDELRALAWDLDAIATAYNFATDPTIPDLAREDVGAWIREGEKIRLERACSLLKEAYDRLYDRVGEDLEQYGEDTSSSDTNHSPDGEGTN